MWEEYIQPKNPEQTQETALNPSPNNFSQMNDYMTNNISLLSNLTWRELETIYCLRVPSLKNYTKNLSQDGKTANGQRFPEQRHDQSLATENKNKIETPDLGNLQASDREATKNTKLSQPEQKDEFFDTAKTTETQKETGISSSGLVQAIEAQLKRERKFRENKQRAELSNSPFAKLKNNALKNIPSTPDISSPQDLTPTESNSDETTEVAWFVEPAMKTDHGSTQSDRSITEYAPAKQPMPPLPIIGVEPVPDSSPIEASSLDRAIDTAFEIMLGPASAQFKAESSAINKSELISPPTPPPIVEKPDLTSSTDPQVSLTSLTKSTLKERGWMPVQSKEEISEISPQEDREQLKGPLPAFDFSLANAITGDQPLIQGSGNQADKPSAKLADIDSELIDDLPSTVSDELRNLIHNHIKHAAEQMADSTPGQSIGTGKEFEVWLNNPARSKFVGSAKSAEIPSAASSSTGFKPRIVPPEIRKSCLILGLRPEEISYEAVQDAWKKAIALPGVHPDQGGDTELAVYLNTAKDTLVQWLEAQAPKLGKKFGPQKREPLAPKEKGKEQK